MIDEVSLGVNRVFENLFRFGTLRGTCRNGIRRALCFNGILEARRRIESMPCSAVCLPRKGRFRKMETLRGNDRFLESIKY